MAMKINGNYDHSETDYVEKMKEKQAAERAEKAKEAEQAAEEKNTGRLSEPQDEYISSEKSGQKPTGLYRVGQDENGSLKIFFPASNEPSGRACTDSWRMPRGSTTPQQAAGLLTDDPKAARAEEKAGLKAEEDRSGDGEDGREPKVSGDGQEKPEEKCVTNTDKVDREIEKLKEKKQQLEQQIQSASGDEQKIRELEKKLAQVESELSQKDNDTYRRQNTAVSGVAE